MFLTSQDILQEGNHLQNENMTSFIEAFLHLVTKEEKKSQSILHLTANENATSEIVRHCLSSSLHQRYHLGTPEDYELTDEVVKKGSLMFKGLPEVYQLENQAIQMIERMLSAKACDFRCLSGIHAVLCTIASSTNPGDLVFSIDPNDGGHFATSTILAALGRKGKYMKFSRSTLLFDLDYLEKLIKEEKPKIILFDHGATMYPFPLKEIRKIAGDDVLLIFDASHVLGLIVGKAFPNPLTSGCNILQGNTHKTFPGPQKAMILFKDETFGKTIIEKIGSGLVSSQHTHHSIALYLAIAEMNYFSASYAAQIVTNAQSLSRHLEEVGFKILKNHLGYTCSHTIFIETKNEEESYIFCKQLHEAGISTNARPIYGKPLIRIGVQEVTRKGMKKNEMREIALLFEKILLKRENSVNLRENVSFLVESFPTIEYSFDFYLEKILNEGKK